MKKLKMAKWTKENIILMINLNPFPNPICEFFQNMWNVGLYRIELNNNNDQDLNIFKILKSLEVVYQIIKNNNIFCNLFYIPIIFCII